MNGLRYERKVGRELQRFVPLRFAKIEHNPWFAFGCVGAAGGGICSPDFLLHLAEGDIVVVEVKLTWIADARAKLTTLYCPVVAAALDRPTIPLIICRNLAPAAPSAAHSLAKALASGERLFHWPEVGALLW